MQHLLSFTIHTNIDDEKQNNNNNRTVVENSYSDVWMNVSCRWSRYSEKEEKAKKWQNKKMCRLANLFCRNFSFCLPLCIWWLVKLCRNRLRDESVNSGVFRRYLTDWLKKTRNGNPCVEFLTLWWRTDGWINGERESECNFRLTKYKMICEHDNFNKRICKI